MHPLIHIPTPDPYAFFFGQQGGKSQVLLHGDDLGANGSSIATWTARHGAIDGTGVNTPTVDASGWTGGGSLALKAANFTGSQHIAFDAEAANYGASTAFTWVIALNPTASASTRIPLALGALSGSSHQRSVRFSAADLAQFSSTISGVGETDAGTAMAEGVQCIIGVSATGGNVLVKQLTAASGIVTHVNTTHAMSGTLTCDKFTMGLLYTGGFVSPCAGKYRFLSAYRGTGVSSSTLDLMMNYTRHMLRCPLP